jgi:hypothetical protein
MLGGRCISPRRCGPSAPGAKRPERAPATANAKAAVDRLPDAVRKKLEEMRAIVLGAGRAQSWHRQLPAAANAKTIGDRLSDAVRKKLEEMRRELQA